MSNVVNFELSIQPKASKLTGRLYMVQMDNQVSKTNLFVLLGVALELLSLPKNVQWCIYVKHQSGSVEFMIIVLGRLVFND